MVSNALKILKNNKYLKNATYLLSDSIIKLGISFFISVAVTRYFGPNSLGKINYILAYVGILQIFVIFGLDSIILRDLSEGKVEERYILGSVLFFRLCMTIFIYIFGRYLFEIVFQVGNELIKLYEILGVSLSIYIFYPLKQVFQLKSLSKYQVYSSQISLILGSILKLIAIYLMIEIEGYAYLLVCISYFEVISLVYFYTKIEGSLFNWRVNFNYLYVALRSSAPLLLQSFAIYIYMKIDQLMIVNILGAEELGIYSIGVMLSEIVYFVPITLVNAYYPKIIENRKENEKYEETFISLGRVNIGVCLIFSIGATLLGRKFINIVYGEVYSKAGIVFQIYSWASIFVGLGVAHIEYLNLENKQIYSLKGNIYGAILNVVLNVFFIKVFGIYGAAISTVLAQAFSNYYYYYFAIKKVFYMRKQSFNLLKLRRKNE